MNTNFEENYFLDKYRAITGDFDEEALVKNVNWYTAYFNQINSILNLKERKGRALELGCGIAAFSKILEIETNIIPEASDVSKYAIKNLKRLHKFKTFELDITNMGKVATRYNYIFAFEVLEHLIDDAKAISNIYKLLAKDGYIIFTTPYPFKKNWDDKTHINMQLPHYWVNMFRREKFQLVEHFPFTPMPFLYRVSKTLSTGLKIRNPLPYLNSTEVFIFRK